MTVENDKRCWQCTERANADISTLAVYLAFFFLRYYPSTEGPKVERFLGYEQAKSMKTFISQYCTDDLIPTELTVMNPVKQDFYRHCFETYQVTDVKTSALRQFISENQYCVVVPDQECVSSLGGQLAVHRMVVQLSQKEIPTFMLSMVETFRVGDAPVSVALLAISTSAWTKVQTFHTSTRTISSRDVVPTTKARYISSVAEFNPMHVN
jgi:hypothetical protein